MKTVILVRFSTNEKQTLGRCYVRNEKGKIVFQSASLERGWLNNKPNESCVPAGAFPLVLEWSPKFEKKLWELKEVPNRSETKFHTSNYWYQLNGCIALGRHHTDINSDGYADVTSSGDTMKDFHAAMSGERAILQIIEIYTHEA